MNKVTKLNDMKKKGVGGVGGGGKQLATVCGLAVQKLSPEMLALQDGDD